MTDSGASTADREIRVTRVLNAPRDLVFKTWVDPQHLANWWGPQGFTITTYEINVVPGGVWRFVMHGPDGVDYQNKIVFVEIVQPERLIYDHVSGPLFRMTVTFEEQGDKTLLTAQMRFESSALRNKVVREFGAEEGLHQTLDRFTEHLVASSEIISSRVFNASRERLFRAFTEPNILARWWGPKGHTNTFIEFDPRPGGQWRFVMHGPDGSDYHTLNQFVEVVSPERIVFDHIDTTHHHRMEMTFADQSGWTRLTWRMRFDSLSEAERVRPLILAANEQNFDRLETQLNSMV
jgi:uncharacterized protein YndB with AHSA1/START domain